MLSLIYNFVKLLYFYWLYFLFNYFSIVIFIINLENHYEIFRNLLSCDWLHHLNLIFLTVFTILYNMNNFFLLIFLIHIFFLIPIDEIIIHFFLL